MDRRQFLGRAGGALAGAMGAALSGCAPRVDADALVLRGWSYEPDLVRQNLERLRGFSPALKVDYAPISGTYHDKMVAQFIAKTPLDLVYVRDDFFAEWVDAGWLRPIDGLPGAEAYPAQFFPFNQEALTYKGHQYGLPYYSDFQIWLWNRRMLEAAGFDHCGRTLDEVAEQCRKIKERRIEGPQGVVTHPIVLGFKQTALGFTDFWALMYASGVRLFTDQLEPIFPDDPGHRAERVLQWLVDAAHKWEILDLEGSLTVPLARDPFAAGRQAMAGINKYDLQRVNDPKRSRVAGDAMMARYPRLEGDAEGTVGWTRMYCVPSYCPRVERSWELMRWLGGRDPQGQLSTARFWYLQRGLGFAYPELLNDAEVVQSTSRWGDISLIRQQAGVARSRECVKAPWFAEFDSIYQAELQEIFMKRVTPRDGLARLAASCRKLRARWA